LLSEITSIIYSILLCIEKYHYNAFSHQRTIWQHIQFYIHQFRSYVLDQSRIKDLRTGVESSNTQAVLDGNLNPFIEASLKKQL